MDLSVRSIICLACILIGVCIQFCFGIGFGTAILGSLILMIGPVCASDNYSENFRDGTQSENPINNWRSFDTASGYEFIAKLVNEQADDKKNAIRDMSPIDAILAFFGGLVMRVIAGIIGFCCIANDDPQLGCLFIDIAFVPYGLFQLKYGQSPAEAFKSFRTSSTMDVSKFQAMKNLTEISMECHSFELHPQFKLVHNGSNNYIDDAKCEITFPKKINRVLAAMISISLNRVQEKKYPYAYYVIVVSGDGPDELEDGLCKLLDNTVFDLEVNHDDGNTIYVMTKKKGYPEYATAGDDYKQLIGVVNESAWLLEKCLGCAES